MKIFIHLCHENCKQLRHSASIRRVLRSTIPKIWTSAKKFTDHKMHRFRAFRYSDHDTSDMEATWINQPKDLLNWCHAIAMSTMSRIPTVFIHFTNFLLALTSSYWLQIKNHFVKCLILNIVYIISYWTVEIVKQESHSGTADITTLNVVISAVPEWLSCFTIILPHTETNLVKNSFLNRCLFSYM